MEIIYQHILCQKIESKIAQNVKYPNYYPNRQLFWICAFFRGGTLVFELFFNFFFEHGIKRYQVTNLSGVHDDLKLWPSIAHFYLHEVTINPRLTKPFFVTRLTGGGGVVTTPSLDFPNWTPYEIDFGINR